MSVELIIERLTRAKNVMEQQIFSLPEEADKQSLKEQLSTMEIKIDKLKQDNEKEKELSKLFDILNENYDKNLKIPCQNLTDSDRKEHSKLVSELMKNILDFSVVFLK